jgi:K(+)-stimulated pyrophosphate-energized sodium pump
MGENLIYILPVFGLIAILVMVVKTLWVNKQDPGTEKMQSISKSIKEGALAFLKAEYRLLFVFHFNAS